MNYIQIMADASKTPQHEVILKCLDRYGVNNTQELTEQQMKEFCEQEVFHNGRVQR